MTITDRSIHAAAKAASRRFRGLLDSVEPATLDIETWLGALAAVGVAQRTLQAPGKVIGEALGIRSAKARIREPSLEEG